jgi:hypothetical protein
MKNPIWIAALFCVVACGRASSPQLQNKPVQAAGVRTFPGQKLHLTQNLILLWKPDVTADQVALVSQLVQKYGEDQVALAKVQAQQGQLPPDVFQAQLADAQKKLGEVVVKLRGVTSGFFGAQFADFALTDTKALTAVLGNVTTPGAQPFTLSTSQGAIRDLRYREWGGQLDFTAVWPNRDVYAFHLARDHYELAAQGGVSFSGSVTVTRPTGEILSGSAQFAGQAVGR